MKELLPLLPAQLNDIVNSLRYFQPEVGLTLLFLLVLGVNFIVPRRADGLCRIIAISGLLIIMVLHKYQYFFTNGDDLMLFNNTLYVTRSGVVLKLIIDVSSVLLLLYLPWDKQLKSHPKGLADAYTIIVGSVLGLHLMVMAANLLSVYLAVEMVSIASYLLVAYPSDKARSAEAGLKYVLFGMASSAMLLYGISLVYAFTGQIGLYNTSLISGLLQVQQPAMLLALLLVFAGIAFKLGAVPLHFWIPDVYQGSATPVMAYVSTIPKIGAFGLLVNFLWAFIFKTGWEKADFQNVLAAVSIITMVVGNFAAVWQNNVKRMLAYSSIGHTGFALMAVAAFTQQGLSALAFYLLVYAIANIGALALATFFKNRADAEELTDYRGLGFTYPLASVCYVVLLISLTGLPVTAGFNAKLLVFSANYTVYEQTHNAWQLAALITGAVTTVVSLFYYLKIPLNLFLRKQERSVPENAGSIYLPVFCLLLTLTVLVLGIFPDLIGKFL